MDCQVGEILVALGDDNVGDLFSPCRTAYGVSGKNRFADLYLVDRLTAPIGQAYRRRVGETVAGGCLFTSRLTQDEVEQDVERGFCCTLRITSVPEIATDFVKPC